MCFAWPQRATEYREGHGCSHGHTWGGTNADGTQIQTAEKEIDRDTDTCGGTGAATDTETEANTHRQKVGEPKYKRQEPNATLSGVLLPVWEAGHCLVEGGGGSEAQNKFVYLKSAFHFGPFNKFHFFSFLMWAVVGGWAAAGQGPKCPPPPSPGGPSTMAC